MRNEDPDDVVVDAADAVTLNQDVQWERCARLAAPASRGALDNLRMLSRAFASGHAAGHAPVGSPLSSTEPYAGPFVQRVLKAIMAIAAVEVVAGLALLPWSLSDSQHQQSDFGIYLTILLVGHAATAGLLLLAGRRDRRTWLLGGYFLLKATVAPLLMLYAFLWGTPPPDMIAAYLVELPAAGGLLGYLSLQPHLYAPAFLWAFARECPRIHRRTRLDDLARRMVPVSMGVGLGIWLGYAASFELARAGYGSAVFEVVVDAGHAALHFLELAAVGIIALRARSAPADEARRVALFSSAFLLYEGMAFAYDVVEAFTPGFWTSNYSWSMYRLLVDLFRFPGMVLLWYSVLAVRVPHPREVVRAFYRRLLMRRGLLVALAAAPAVAMGLLVTSRPERAVGAFIADPLVLSLAAAFGTMLLAAAGRERILVRLDAWVVPETTDQRQALAAAAAAVAQAGGIEALSRTVTRAIRRSCGSPATLLVASEVGTGTEDFEAWDAALPPLARASSIVHMLERAGGSVRVHPTDATSMFELLPPVEAAWVVDTEADAVVAVIGPGAEVIGDTGCRPALRRPDCAVRRRSVSRSGCGGSRAGDCAPALAARPANWFAGRSAGARVPAVRMPGGNRHGARVRLRIGVRRGGGSGAAGRQVSPDAALGKRRHGEGIRGARHATPARRGHQDPAGAFSGAVDGDAVRSLDHGDGGAPGAGPDLWHRVVARPPVPGSRVPGRRHASGSAAARTDRAAARGCHNRRPGGGARGAARGALSAPGHQARQHRVHVGRVAEAAGFRSGRRHG